MCSLNGSAQDRSCTPGALNPAVRQKAISRTICETSYTTRIRPPSSYTDPLKLESMKAYGLGTDTSAYEFDHLISLELGGAPSDIRNLWRSPTQDDPLPTARTAWTAEGELDRAHPQRMRTDSQRLVPSNSASTSRRPRSARPRAR